MPTDITITTPIISSGRQDSESPVSTISNKRAATRTAEISSVQDEVSASDERQAITAADQNLPPGEVVADTDADTESLRKAVSDINDYVQNIQRDLQFQVDTDLGQTVVSVVDSSTQEIIRQIPSEEVLARARFLEAQATDADVPDGLLLQVKV
ncbi:hypothetical protein MNBD_GAMMA13-324 [hydrothermal vent metagenome]|uniref:Flagellar protein FlaG n=1 Tax=hydrothermal vent metagenome TaxID=652676 RepID=A0A3B0YHP4_9ZZZZ